MAIHLVKCKLNYGEQKMVPCDFNVTHMIAEPEFQVGYLSHTIIILRDTLT